MPGKHGIHMTGTEKNALKRFRELRKILGISGLGFYGLLLDEIQEGLAVCEEDHLEARVRSVGFGALTKIIGHDTGSPFFFQFLRAAGLNEHQLTFDEFRRAIRTWWKYEGVIWYNRATASAESDWAEDGEIEEPEEE